MPYVCPSCGWSADQKLNLCPVCGARLTWTSASNPENRCHKNSSCAQSGTWKNSVVTKNTAANQTTKNTFVSKSITNKRNQASTARTPGPKHLSHNQDSQRRTASKPAGTSKRSEADLSAYMERLTNLLVSYLDDSSAGSKEDRSAHIEEIRNTIDSWWENLSPTQKEELSSSFKIIDDIIDSWWEDSSPTQKEELSSSFKIIDDIIDSYWK